MIIQHTALIDPNKLKPVHQSIFILLKMHVVQRFLISNLKLKTQHCHDINVNDNIHFCVCILLTAPVYV